MSQPQTTQPSPTLYIQNVDEKLKKEDLKRVLYMLFSTHGKVLDVIVKRTGGMRGQAFVVFRDLQSATLARRKEDGMYLLGRPMRISYAKGKSHATIVLEDGPEALYLAKLGITEAKNKLTVSGAQKANIDAKKKRAREEANEEESEEEEEEGDSKRPKVNGVEQDEEAPMEEDSDEEGPKPGPSEEPAVPVEPHHILAVEDLPAEVTDDMLKVLFVQYPGFVAVKHQPSKHEAQVQFETWQMAGDALEGLDGFQLSGEAVLHVSYAKR